MVDTIFFSLIWHGLRVTKTGTVEYNGHAPAWFPQQQKFDPDGGYIYRWLPELRQFPIERIHRWDKKQGGGDYPASIVDHAAEISAAMQAVLRPGGAGVRPAGPPKLLTGDEAGSELAAGANFLEDAAREKPDPAQFAAPGTTTYTVSLDKSEPLIWAYAWCAKDAATLEENLKRIRLKFVLDGVETGMDKMSTYGSDANGKKCMLIYAGLSDWPAGEHHLSTMATFTGTLNDGVTEFPAGEYVLEYMVYVGG